MKIMISSYLISGWLIFFVLGSTLFYILCYIIISGSLTSSMEFGTFYMLAEAPQMYFSLILLSFMFVLVDTGMQYLNTYINKWYTAQKDKAKAEHARMQAKSKSVIKRKVTSYKSKKSPFTYVVDHPCLFFRSRFCLLLGGRKRSTLDKFLE